MVSLADLSALGLPLVRLESSAPAPKTAQKPKAASPKASPKSAPKAEPKPKPKAAAAKPKEETRQMAPANALAPEEARRMAGDAAGAQAGATKALWLEDTYCFTASSKLRTIVATPDGKLRLTFDQTVFHPQGGGQPTDVGSISADGLPPLAVTMVSMDKESGAVLHDCTSEAADAWLALKPGSAVTLAVDEAKRRANARLHSAGHLIDVAVANAGYGWVAGKGYHFPDGAYVEYIMTAEQKAAVNKDAALAAINEKLKALLAKPTPVKVELREGVRTVEVEGTACPCGGTHVKSTGELGEVSIKALKAKGMNMRVSYVMAA
eukprot:TRINITY_DN54575_c0_g1_i1.p1 TRINITY_DN54575_c0_g1~~TRINITY_DN54575_c0_g1_i1.p1  ORF type:complete len:345 (+),score=78.18 TRINITY_DN54575_c0_g1_i1:71-1036(+)